jgi:hypothetical protein
MRSCFVWLAVAIGLALIVGCKREFPRMAGELKTWERPRHEPGDGNALVFYVVYGSFTNDATISRTKYRTEDLPKGITLRKVTRNDRPLLPFTEGDFGKFLRGENWNLFTRVGQAPECIVLQGEIPDPRDLNYLRDCVGTITYFMDNGGMAVLDAQQIKFYDAATWHREFFEPQNPDVRRHVIILLSDDKGGGRWFHTRGMRKFARPDLSLRNVPDKFERAAIELCNRFIALQAEGARIPEGQEITMASLPNGLICRHKGSLDDPDFNNLHVEIQFPMVR